MNLQNQYSTYISIWNYKLDNTDVETLNRKLQTLMTQYNMHYALSGDQILKEYIYNFINGEKLNWISKTNTTISEETSLANNALWKLVQKSNDNRTLLKLSNTKHILSQDRYLGCGNKTSYTKRFQHNSIDKK